MALLVASPPSVYVEAWRRRRGGGRRDERVLVWSGPVIANKRERGQSGPSTPSLGPRRDLLPGRPLPLHPSAPAEV